MSEFHNTSDTTWDYDRFDYAAIVQAEDVMSIQFDVSMHILSGQCR